MSVEVTTLTVGALQENCYIVRRPGAETALIFDPGDEAERILAALEERGISTVAAILLTHTHFDHVGAVTPVQAATSAPVYCPVREAEILANINDYVRFPGFGPFDSYVADETVAGGESLELAGLTVDVHFTPGHSPGHVTYALREENTLLSGDVLFMGSVGRVDLPGGDWPTLLASIDGLLGAYPDDATVYPGHGPITTLGHERASNPFLTELAHR
ncbi:MBL fold metallo-hydrolase [Conexibacter sp. DBS9H8]|uniref:MBL fold metallo-hydrolase n=1 Tax=Conexibacter sp. DBS9H8 TaxID=2937801 RepID=UPI00200D3251|nr:MBL fold metallo-hydrolase [Conexibacter sp. DBS9H8]